MIHKNKMRSRMDDPNKSPNIRLTVCGENLIDTKTSTYWKTVSCVKCLEQKPLQINILPALETKLINLTR